MKWAPKCLGLNRKRKRFVGIVRCESEQKRVCRPLEYSLSPRREQLADRIVRGKVRQRFMAFDRSATFTRFRLNLHAPPAASIE